jgi:hypothetical protein
MMSQERWAPWIYWLFVTATAATYLWQIPYYLHFSAVRGSAPAPLAVLLPVTFAWFAAAAVWVYWRRPRGFGWMVAFLVYLVRHRAQLVEGRGAGGGDGTGAGGAGQHGGELGGAATVG